MEEKGLPEPSGYQLSQLNFEASYNAIGKYGGPNIILGDEQQLDFELAQEWAKMHFGAALYTDTELDYEDVFAEMDHARSPGFPWNCMYTTNKECWEKHRDYMDCFRQDVEDGLKPICFWNVFPKEEVLPDEKVNAGKVRQISGAPLELKLLSNSIMLAQNNRFYEWHGKCWSQVGINPFGLGWQELYSSLRNTSNLGKAMDVSRFDANYQCHMAAAVKELRWNCMSHKMRTEKNRRKLDYVYDSVFRGYLVCPNGEVLQKEHGNNSGSSNTVVDNTLALGITLMYAWIRGCRDREIEPDYQHMMQCIAAALYGDDNTFVATQQGRAVLTEEVMRRAFADHGWNITFETDGWTELKDLVFLSRKFKLAGQWIVPAPTDSSKAMCSLLHKSKGDPYDDYVRACGLLNMYYYDEGACAQLTDFLDWMECAYGIGDATDEKMRNIRSNRLDERRIVQLYTVRDLDWTVEGRAPTKAKSGLDFLNFLVSEQDYNGLAEPCYGWKNWALA